MSEMEPVVTETRERLSEQELKTLEELAYKAFKDETLAEQLARNPGAVLEQYELSLSTVEGAAVEILDPETDLYVKICPKDYTDGRIVCKGWYIEL